MKKDHIFTAVAITIFFCLTLLVACNRPAGQKNSQATLESQSTPIVPSTSVTPATSDAAITTVKESPAPTPSRFLPDYYAIKRISINTESGITAINPGTKAAIKEQFENGTYNIAFEEYEVVVDKSYVSNDADIVKAASVSSRSLSLLRFRLATRHPRSLFTKQNGTNGTQHYLR